MSVIELAIYAEDDPNGTPVVTLDETDLLTCELRLTAYEMGEAMFQISLHHAAVTSGFIADDRLVKVTIPSVSASPIWAFWLKNTRASIVHHDEQGGEIGTFGGPGMLAILGLGQLNSEHYAPGQPERGSVSEIGIWKWINEPYGAILTRGIEEGQYQPGYPLADVTIDFDRDLDSDGVAWVNIAEDFQTQIGTGLGQLTSQLVEAGDLKLIGHPDLLIQAFHSYGRDLTGSFGAGNVRFEKGVNIITELVRVGNARQKWTHVLLRDKDGGYSEEVDPGFGAGDRAHWGFWSADQTNDAPMLNRIGQEVIDASHTQPEAIELEITPGFDPAAGRYMPGPEGTNGHFWLFDRITLDANVGSFGYNEAEQEIVAIRIVLDVAADGTTADTSARSLHIVPELNYRAHRYGVPPAQVIPLHTPPAVCFARVGETFNRSGQWGLSEFGSEWVQLNEPSQNERVFILDGEGVLVWNMDASAGAQATWPTYMTTAVPMTVPIELRARFRWNDDGNMAEQEEEPTLAGDPSVMLRLELPGLGYVELTINYDEPGAGTSTFEVNLHDGTSSTLIDTGTFANDSKNLAYAFLALRIEAAAVKGKFWFMGDAEPAFSSSAATPPATGSTLRVQSQQTGGIIAVADTRINYISFLEGVDVTCPTTGGPDASGGTDTAHYALPDHDHDSVDNGDVPGGDLGGTYPNPTVSKIEGVDISTTDPVAGQVLTATSGAAAEWQDPASGTALAVDDHNGNVITDVTVITFAEGLVTEINPGEAYMVHNYTSLAKWGMD